MVNPHSVLGRERQVALARLLVECLETCPPPFGPAATAAYYVDVFRLIDEVNGRPPKYLALEFLEKSAWRDRLEVLLVAAGFPSVEVGKWRPVRADRDVYFARDRQRMLASVIFKACALGAIAGEEARQALYRIDAAFAAFNGRADAFRDRFEALIAKRAWLSVDLVDGFG